MIDLLYHGTRKMAALIVLASICAIAYSALLGGEVIFSVAMLCLVFGAVLWFLFGGILIKEGYYEGRTW